MVLVSNGIYPSPQLDRDREQPGRSRVLPCFPGDGLGRQLALCRVTLSTWGCSRPVGWWRFYLEGSCKTASTSGVAARPSSPSGTTTEVAATCVVRGPSRLWTTRRSRG